MKIIDVRGIKPNSPDVVYCGRGWAGWAASPLGNPCHLSRRCPMCSDIHETGGDTLPCYRFWLLGEIIKGNKEVVGALSALKEDSVLGCWCGPDKPCHCQVIADVWERYVRC